MSDAVTARYKVKQELYEVMRRSRIRQGLTWQRAGTAFAAVALFTTLSVTSLSFALGVWWVPGSIQVERTGLIQIQSPLTDTPVRVYLNGTLVTDRLPAHLDRLRPQRYLVRVEKDGYQSWERSVEVKPNQRVLYSNLLLVRDEVTFAADAAVSPQDSRFIATDERDLFIKNTSELWYLDTLVVRMSDAIRTVRWHPLRSYVLVQTDKAVQLVSLDGLTVLTLLESTEKQALPVPAFFERGGRELVLSLESGVVFTKLYEATSLIDLLVGYRRTE
jgi:hypothetical protein